MSTYSDGEPVRELVEAATEHTLTICAPGGGSWHYVVSVEQAARVWRYLRTTGAPLVTDGIGADAAIPRRHGEMGE